MEINCSLSSLNFPTQFDLQTLTHHPLHSFASPMELKHFTYAHQIFYSVQKPRAVVWNFCLKGLAEGDCPLEALLLFDRLRVCNVLPDNCTCSFVLKACTKLLDLANGRIIHGYIEKLGFRWNLVLDKDNIILNLYSLCGEIGDAQKLFGTRPHPRCHYMEYNDFQLVKRGGTFRTPQLCYWICRRVKKVKTLYSHSEKLALLFGLINTKPGKTIRIMKNLRVCEDCHATFKILSGVVVKQEIVVRDRNRFHSLKDGSSSCKEGLLVALREAADEWS